MSDPPACPLSPRQLEIVSLRAQGMTQRGISNRLGISLQTVKNHGTAIFDRMGVRTMVEVVRIGTKEGWLE